MLNLLTCSFDSPKPLRLDHWDAILGASHMEWLDDAERIANSFLGSVTDVCLGLRLSHGTSFSVCTAPIPCLFWQGLLWHL